MQLLWLVLYMILTYIILLFGTSAILQWFMSGRLKKHIAKQTEINVTTVNMESQTSKKNRKWKETKKVESKSQESVKECSKRSAELVQSTKNNTASSKSTPKLKPKITKDVLPKGQLEKLERGNTKESSGTFTKDLQSLLVFIVSYRENPDRFRVAPEVNPGFIYDKFGYKAPIHGTAFKNVLEDFKELLLPGMLHWCHPRFFCNNLCHRSYGDTIGTIFSSMLSVPSPTWESCPSGAELEVQVINWTAKAIGLPRDFMIIDNPDTSLGGGTIMNSNAETLLSVVMAAKCWKINQVLVSLNELSSMENYLFAPEMTSKFHRQHDIASKLVVYANKNAHLSLPKAARFAMMSLRDIAVVSEFDYGINPEDLDNQIQEDIGKGLIPCLIIGTCGLQTSLASDPVQALAAVSEKYGCWLHVDASSVGSFWVDSRNRTDVPSLAKARSISVEMAYHMHSVVVLWTRNQEEWKRGFGDRANYQKTKRSSTLDSRDYGIQNNRYLKALSLYFNFKANGLKNMKSHTSNIISLAVLLEGYLSSHKNIKVFFQRTLNNITFQYYESKMTSRGVSTHTHRLATFMNESHKVRVNVGKIAGATVISLAISYESMTAMDVVKIWKDMESLINDYRKRKHEAGLLRQSPVTENLESIGSSEVVDHNIPVDYLCKFSVKKSDI